MALTKEQVEQLGFQFFESPQQPGYNLEHSAVGPQGIIQKLDSPTVDYLKSIGITPTLADRSSSSPLSRYNTVGGATVTTGFLEERYGAIAQRQQQAQEAQNNQLGNAAIKANNVADVEKYFPGYTMWNGAFVMKSKIPELQAQGATVQGGNVVGAPLNVPAGSPGAALQTALKANPNLTPQQQHQASLQGTPIPGTTPVAPGQQGIQPPIPPTNPATGQPGGAGVAPELAAFNQQMVNAPPVTSSGLEILTPSQPTNANNQVWKDENNNVFEVGSNRPISLNEFKQKGLNIDHINTKAKPTPTGPAGPAPAVEATPEKTPSDFLTDYKNIIKELGLTDIKTQIENIQKEYKKLQDEKIDNVAEVNNNPWLSEGLRSKSVQSINSKYEAKEAALTNTLKLFDSIFDEGMEQAKFLTSGIQADRNKLLELAQKKADAEAKLLELDTQVVEANGRKLLINSKTGKTIVDLGAVKVTGGGTGGGGPAFKGFTGDETVSIKNDLAQYGIDKVLEGITDPKQVAAITALAKNVETTVSKLTRSNMSSLFGIKDNDDKSGFLGFFGKGKTNRGKLDELMVSIKQYQDVGYSDQEILKLMK